MSLFCCEYKMECANEIQSRKVQSRPIPFSSLNQCLCDCPPDRTCTSRHRCCKRQPKMANRFFSPLFMLVLMLYAVQIPQIEAEGESLLSIVK